MKDVYNVLIEVGDTVQTVQQPGGLFEPAPHSVGIVEECKDAFGNDSLQIRCEKDYKGYEKIILINGKINKVLKKFKEV